MTAHFVGKPVKYAVKDTLINSIIHETGVCCCKSAVHIIEEARLSSDLNAGCASAHAVTLQLNMSKHAFVFFDQRPIMRANVRRPKSCLKQEM